MPQRPRKPSFSGAYPRERPSRRRGIRLAAIAVAVIVIFVILTTSPVPAAGAGAAKQAVFGPPVHEPLIKSEDKTIGEGKWYNDWKWLNPFSDSITSYENGVVLPPIRERVPIYAFYDTSADRSEATREAENKLLLIWRRAWWAQGFRPVILGRGEAMKNELYVSVQAKELERKIEIEVMRWLAWEQMGSGILANWLVLPMGPYDDPNLSYLRRGEYPILTRYVGLGGGLFSGEKGAIREALTTALQSSKLTKAKSFLDVFDTQRLAVSEPKPDSIAFYDAQVLSTNYKAIETALTEDKPKGLHSLAQLITSHLHLTFLNTFSTGFAILTPFPGHTLTLSQPALALAHSLATCPETPMPGACPPNLPSCTPCTRRRPIQIATPTSYYNTSSLYTIGTLPHPYTLAALLAPTKDITIRHIRRDTDRDRWLQAVTESTLGREISGPDRIVSFKETVAADWGSWRGLWMTEEPAIPEHRDLEWHFGFSLPFVNATNLVPKNQQPTDKELKTQSKILEKAKEVIKVKKARKGHMEMRVKNAVEAWNLADTEAWRFVRALGRRETLLRRKWEDEEKAFAGGQDVEGRGKGWGRWFDRA